MKEWPLLNSNQSIVKDYKSRTVLLNGFPIEIHHNQIRSASCTTDPKEKRSVCPLCLPGEYPLQKAIPFEGPSGSKYRIQLNPFPLCHKHYTICDQSHCSQTSLYRIDDMLHLAEEMSSYVIFYNGAGCGASIPDHFHFQAVPRGILPFEAGMNSFLKKKSKLLKTIGGFRADTIPLWPVRQIIMSAKETDIISDSYDWLMDKMCALNAGEYPLINLLCWKSRSTFRLCIFPRSAWRPRVFYASGEDRIIVSPGSVEMAGFVVTPRLEDYERINPDIMMQIYNDVSPGEEDFNKWKL